VDNLLFFRRSLATRHAAIQTMRQARAMPPGPERHAARRFARALRDLAKTEAWLEGQTPGRRTGGYGRADPDRAPGFRGGMPIATAPGGARLEPRSLFGET
jgi:hypothetical protein